MDLGGRLASTHVVRNDHYKLLPLQGDLYDNVRYPINVGLEQ